MLHLGDITRIHGAGVPAVEVVIGGSPCQDLSVAGKRAGLDGERSGLFMDQIRVIKEMRDYDKRVNARTGADVRPRYMVWENVPGAFSSAGGEDFRAVLEETAHIVEEDAVIPRPEKGKWQTAGCIMGDGWSIAWRVLDAQFWGVPQRRRRIALVADFGGDTAPEILFERESVSGDSQESGTAREGTAGDAENGVDKAVDGVKCLTPWDCQSKRVFDTDGAMSTYQAMGDSGANNVAVCYSFDALASNSMKSANPNSGCREVECSKTLDCFDPNPSKNQGGIAVVQKAICMATQQGGAEIAVDLCPTITASAGMSGNNQPCVVYNEETITSKTNASNPAVGDPRHTLGATGAGRAICIQGNCIDRADTAGCNGKGWRDDDVSFTLNTIDRPAVYDARGNGDGTTAPTLTGDHQNRVTDYTALTFQNTGHGWWNESPVGATIRTPSGGDSTLANIVCAVDCQNGTGNPDTNGTLQAKSNGGMSLNLQNTVRVQNLVRRLTPLECERLQGYPSTHQVDVSQMTKDEYIAWNIADGNIIVDAVNGIIYGTRGPGGVRYETPKELTGSIVNGYRIVNIRNGKTKLQCRAHRVVWISQNGVIPEGYCVDHINNDKLDNRISNLQLLTPEDNSHKAHDDGLYATGVDNKATKIDPALKDEICYLYAVSDVTQRQLAEMYGISKSRVNQIIKEVGWTDIGEWVDSKGKKHESSDSARYKALGNSIALPPWRFVLGRLNAYLTEHTMASLFDGIGGFPLIWRELNGEGKCLWASEIEEFPIAVTKRRFND